MSKIVFDIETVGEDFEELDETSKDLLLRWAEDEAAEQEVKDGLGFSPLTGQIVAIGVLDVDENKGAVYFQSETSIEQETDGVKLKSMSEKEMLEKFWDIA